MAGEEVRYLKRRLAAVVLLLASCRGGEKTAGNAPVIIISVDTLRADRLPIYGYKNVATPNIDALRRDSILFERAWSHCPMTLPAHASLFTGLLPPEHGVRNNIGYKFDAARFRTLAELLREKGYRTGAAVSSYVLRSDTGIDDGFETYDDAIPVATAGATSEHQRSGFETLAVARRWIAANASQPFFYFFHIYEPHAPHEPSYDAEVEKSDQIVGQLVAHLKSVGVYDRAIVVFLSDHGEGLWDHGEDQHGILLYRESIQIPLLIKLPDSEQSGSSVPRAVSISDVFATLLDVLGIEKATRSLLRESPPKAIYAETLYPRIHLGWSELRSIVDERYHYIDGPKAELYDLSNDPRERSNVIATERRIAAAMKRQIDAVPPAIAPIAPVDKEEAAKLAALGYIGTPQNRSGPLPNPRDEIGSLAEIKKAFALAEERRYDEAAMALRALLERNPRLADVASKLGEVLVQAGRPREAIDVYREAIARAERFSPDLLLGAGFAHLKAGQPEQAVAHAELALRASPREANELLARAKVEQRRLAEAEAAARQAVELGDRQPASLLLLAEVQRAAGKLDAALQTIGEAEQRATELGVKHLYGAGYLRGDVLARLGRVDEAIAAYQREIANAPDHLQAYANLAIIYFIEGKTREGEQTLDALMRANPHRGARELAEKTRRAVRE